MKTTVIKPAKLNICSIVAIPNHIQNLLMNFPKSRVTGFSCLAVTFFMIAGTGCVTSAPNSADNGGISDDEIRDVVLRVANHQIHPLSEGDYPQDLTAAKTAKAPEGIMWSYPWGVALFGMEHTANTIGDKDAYQFVNKHNVICASYYHWLAGLENQYGDEAKEFARTTKIKGLVSLGNLDSCGAMGNQMIQCMMDHPNEVTPEEKDVVARIGNWVVHQQARLPDGTLWRPKEYDGTVWPDDLYMGGVFLVRYGIYTHNPKLIDDAAEQIIHQAPLEQDSDGLWFHGYYMTNKLHAPFKWGRGNGWVTVSLVETLSAMPENDPLRPQLLDILRKQIDGLKKVQAPDGMWRQVLDKPELWEETSCTAMFAYGIARAVNRGWIEPDNMVMARRAFAGLVKNVGPDGAVHGTCQGTSMSTDLDYYIKRERPDDDPHGRGPVMLAGTEILAAAKK
jgi:unsaturated rhamnogalacturonyl hydrolase